MHKKFIRIVMVAFFSLYSILSEGQIFEKEGERVIYNRIFVKTDNFGTSYLDTLQQALSRIKIDTLKFSVLNDLAYYWHTRNLTTALKFTEEGLDLTNTEKDSVYHGRFLITKGSILLRQEKLDEARHALNRAKNLVIEKDLPFLHTQLGYVYERQGELDRAADEALISLDIGEKTNDYRAQAIAYSDLSNLLWKQSKFDKGLEFGLKSLELFESRNINDLDYDFTLYVVGNNYLELEKFDLALKYYRHSIAIGERYGFYNNLSDVYISITELYTKLKDYEKASEAGAKALTYAQLLDNTFMEMRSWLSIGMLNNKIGDYEKAIESFQNSITIATIDFGDEYFLNQAYKGLSEAYYKNLQFNEAYLALKKYDSLKELIFTAEADQRISVLQTEYDVAQKEDTIALQQLQLDRKNTQQILILVVALSLFIILVTLFIFLRKNRLKNKLLNRQNEEKEFLLKEIHHRVKNNLEVVSSLLELQSATLTDYNAKSIMQESQNRVHSMSLIHQKLYQGENLASIEMNDYLKNLGNNVLSSFGAENKVSMSYDVEKIELDVDTAIPLGLIVNELLTNALKYAFPKNQKGSIQISLNYLNKETLKLEIGDNGIGFKENDIKGTGFGRQLIGLLTKQLEGIITTNTDDGSSIKLEFKI